MAWRRLAVGASGMLLIVAAFLLSLDHVDDANALLESRQNGGAAQHHHVEKSQGKALHAKSGRAGTKVMLKGKQQLEEVEKKQVMMCAKKITGDDTPRKLPPDVRDKVLECAKNYMPPVNTKHLLEEAAKKVMSAAKTPEEQEDAKNLLTSGEQEKEAETTTQKVSSNPQF
eukprot:768684-Hanusia_phi.AAC.3